MKALAVLLGSQNFALSRMKWPAFKGNGSYQRVRSSVLWRNWLQGRRRTAPHGRGPLSSCWYAGSSSRHPPVLRSPAHPTISQHVRRSHCESGQPQGLRRRSRAVRCHILRHSAGTSSIAVPWASKEAAGADRLAGCMAARPRCSVPETHAERRAAAVSAESSHPRQVRFSRLALRYFELTQLMEI